MTGALRRNIFWLVFSQAATWLVSFALLILAPARLDADGYGRLQFSIAYIGFFALFGGLGSYQLIVKAVARDHSAIPSLVRSALRLKLVLGLGLAVTALGLGKLFGYSNEVLSLIAIGGVGMTLALLNDILVAALAGTERMAKPALWQTVQVYVGSIGAIVVVLTTRSLVMVAACGAVALGIPLVANYLAIRPLLRQDSTTTSVSWKMLVAGGVPLLLLTVFNTIYGTIDIPILDAVSGADTVGWYSLAHRWVGMPIFVTTIVVTAFLPSMSALAATSLQEFGALTNRALRLVVFVTLPAAIGMAFIASDLINLLYRDGDYDNSIVLMQILAIHIPITAFDTVLATALVASDRHRRYVFVAAAAAVMNPPLAFFAIRLTDSRYSNGAIGAACVTLLTEVFILLWALKLRPRTVIDRYSLGYFGRCLLSVGLMTIPLVVLGGQGVFVKFVAGTITFAAASLLFRTVSAARVKRLLNDVLRGRSGGLGRTNDVATNEALEEGAIHD